VAEGTPNSVGRANLELGVNAKPMEKGLDAAKAEAVKKVEETEKAVQLKREANAVKESTKESASASSAVASNIKRSGDEAATAGIKFGQLKAGLLAIVAAAQQLWKGLKDARSAGEDFGASMRNIEAAFRSDVQASLDPITKRREEIARTAREQNAALEEEIRQRNIIQDLVAAAYGDPEIEARRQKIAEETRAALNRLNETKKQDTDRLGEEARAELRASRAKIDLARKRIADEAEERARAEIEANKRIEDDRRARMEETYAQLGRLQQAQFTQLRNDINGLFQTSGLEVGINRIGALIETMIQKIGDQR
jgi:hypothetical protein